MCVTSECPTKVSKTKEIGNWEAHCVSDTQRATATDSMDHLFFVSWREGGELGMWAS